MKQHPQTPRAAIALLLAGIALPLNPAFAQDASVADPPVVNAPPPVTAPVAQPPVVRVTPPPAATPAPQVQAVPAPPPPRAVQPAAEPTPTATRSPSRPAARRAEAPARPAPVESAAAEPAPAAGPIAEPLAEPAAPLAEQPAAQPAAMPPVSGDLAATQDGGTGIGPALPWLIGAAVLAIVAFAAYALRRRRRRTVEERRAEAYAPTRETAPSPGLSAPAAFAAAVPLAAAAPLTAASPPVHDVDRVEQPAGPAGAAVDRISVGEPDAADVDALAAASQAPDGRPWLEFLLRPVRAGTTGEDTVVEFELTVGNTGSVSAKDVRISTWMFAAGSAAETEMERMLIEPPADAQHSDVSIPAGDGARVDAALALPKTGRDEPVLPVVVADARYTLPDGSEGRTSASFEIGMAGDEALAPFPTDRASGLLESVEARLHGELERA